MDAPAPHIVFAEAYLFADSPRGKVRLCRALGIRSIVALYDMAAEAQVEPLAPAQAQVVYDSARERGLGTEECRIRFCLAEELEDYERRFHTRRAAQARREWASRRSAEAVLCGVRAPA